ncbi:coproporphyrinogen-III oxidase family protein [Nocardia takedensis]
MTTLEQDIASAHKFIERNLSVRQVNKILHTFPSPRQWTERRLPVRDLLRARADLGESRDLALYSSVPFCLKTNPDRCGYCLFPVEVFRGNKDLVHYFEYYKREAEFYEGVFDNDTVSSIYFGGGTSNLYHPEMYGPLMEVVRGKFRVAEDAIITLEGIPQLFSREKIQAIREAGMNRISIGVQQMDDELNALSGRKQRLAHTFDTIAWCAEFGLPCNADLIFGWPRQTVESMIDGLQRLVETGIQHLTHYELNIGGGTDFAMNRQHELPSVRENLEMYHASAEFLRGKGYRQLTAYDWERVEDVDDALYEECVRDFGRHEMFGMGYAAVSHMETGGEHRAVSYRNSVTLAEYLRGIDEGRVPADDAYYYNDLDYRMSLLFRNLQSLALDLGSYRERFGVDLLDEHAAAFTALIDRGFVTVDEEVLRIVGDGVFYIPMIQTLLSKARLAEITRAGLGARERVALPLLTDGAGSRP